LVARCIVMGERKGITGRRGVNVPRRGKLGIQLVIIEHSDTKLPRQKIKEPYRINWHIIYYNVPPQMDDYQAPERVMKSIPVPNSWVVGSIQGVLERWFTALLKSYNCSSKLGHDNITRVHSGSQSLTIFHYFLPQVLISQTKLQAVQQEVLTLS
jgi:hypothetical protein